MTYFLFIYGDYKEYPQIIKNIAKILSKVSSEDVKYQYGDAGGVYHFKSVQTLTELKESLSPILKDVCAMYFLFQENENMFYNFFDKEIESHLMLFDKESTDSDKLIENIDSQPYDIPLDYLEEIAILFSTFAENISITEEEKDKKIEKKPSLDELLDLINEKGINNLTEKEKEQLYEYSKK
jgi:hypothetical protein